MYLATTVHGAALASGTEARVSTWKQAPPADAE